MTRGGLRAEGRPAGSLFNVFTKLTVHVCTNVPHGCDRVWCGARAADAAPNAHSREGEAPPTKPILMFSPEGPLVSGTRNKGPGHGRSTSPCSREPGPQETSTGAPDPPGARGGGSAQCVGCVEGGRVPGRPPRGAQDSPGSPAETGAGEEASHTGLCSPAPAGTGWTAPPACSTPFNPDLKHNRPNQAFSPRAGPGCPPARCPRGSLVTVMDRLARSVPEPSIK